MVDGSRLKILEILQRNPDPTVHSLAAILGLAPATIRRHLDILQRDDLVSSHILRRKAGRPTYVYSLTELGEAHLHKDYQSLLAMLLQQIEGLSTSELKSQGDEQKLTEVLFARMGQEVARGHLTGFEGNSVSERRKVLLGILGKEHFAPEAEEAPGGTVIKLYNCPFRSTALGYPSVCNYDEHLISSVMNSPVLRQQWITQGDRICTYLMPARKSS